ncbi:cytochrome c maturation protein CcmE [Bacillus shivajii]|uniref:cytochrome c maturation protein CcmE n=1 Tax=Bacillus shivajii TaxID=1983719 RepID=UPI001CFA060D|nr:cytochrome c maturation protein CcmE [Bacillus shivajii]UCZ52502.1 cytochrome c maturation protein CcmE [Bacillus shivajii]
MKKNTKVIFGGSLILVSILILLVAATPSSSGSEINISEALENASQYDGRYVTTEGFLIEETIIWDADNIEIRFEIEDEDGNRLPVYHHGVRPDNFSDGVIVIVHGYLNQDDYFEAERVQTRCPSVYEGKDPEEYDKEFHRELLQNED